MALVLWGFLSEMFNTGIERTTLAAVVRIHQQLNSRGDTPCALNNGNYCSARSRIPADVPKEPRKVKQRQKAHDFLLEPRSIAKQRLSGELPERKNTTNPEPDKRRKKEPYYPSLAAASMAAKNG